MESRGVRVIAPMHDSEKQKWGRHRQMVTGSFLIPTSRDRSQESKADHKSWHQIFISKFYILGWLKLSLLLSSKQWIQNKTVMVSLFILLANLQIKKNSSILSV